ncbi:MULTISPECIES: MnhB domain-containing protein [Pseudomonadota]|jgi:multicomponent Na+:H+ antiporter subunit B|uniref:MnhB domain-containing protein n=1 Tax=Pseudomonadota TaxID=1224 RepID=UPI00053D6D99|nr:MULTISPECIES: MnhB domain-containing protein [Pseudomonadota]KSE61618.1 Na(+)/H(+) antiporter subunit B [Pseudomonas aeruginosa]MBV5648756.1 Na(+)/H(+) antiporter subunit B [Pseudomonas aeruginosa]MCO2027266.1 Na(+)/H(+) antiporter subunit B [Pseudomonas aeruginosa]MDC3951920.1 Na(+)/H(+) antiporter subunit B [Pseudomonas aeruginosa]NTS98847.1 Na(+)/H(+) antiporter subunit B [Pseudomonas aeruginosa]
MPSIIFSTMARVFFWLMLVASILILLRGHNQPGGGFVGGLVAAMAIGVVALADGVPRARALLPLHPITVIGLGILLGILGGLPGLLITGNFLEHQWLLLGSFKLGTTMVFDLGVYFVVLGGMLALIFRLYEDAP